MSAGCHRNERLDGAGFVARGEAPCASNVAWRKANDRGDCKRRSKNPSLEATEWFGCARVKIRQSESLSLIRARARDEGLGKITGTHGSELGQPPFNPIHDDG